jgi:hypothetical protein
MIKILRNTEEIDVRNIEQLPAGLGCRFLLCLESHLINDRYIAKRWLRKLPKETKECEAIIDFG